MGTAFPLGMRLAASRSTALGAWLWGINGAASVCASVLAVAIALHRGIAAGFWTGVACYAAAAVALAVESRRQRAGHCASRVGSGEATRPGRPLPSAT
jgi:hypothetical protein